MIPAKRSIFLSAASAFLLATLALSVQPQAPPAGRPNPSARPTPKPAAPEVDYEPMWAVNGTIRWRKDYGVAPITANLENSVNNRCGSVFFVAAVDPRTNQPIRGEHSQIWNLDNYRDHYYNGNYYACRYALKLPANRQVRVIASMGSDVRLPDVDPNPLFLTRAWIGGNAAQAQPPAGSMRTFTGSKYVTLTQASPRATVDFEMIYQAPRGGNPR